MNKLPVIQTKISDQIIASANMMSFRVGWIPFGWVAAVNASCSSSQRHAVQIQLNMHASLITGCGKEFTMAIAISFSITELVGPGAWDVVMTADSFSMPRLVHGCSVLAGAHGQSDN